MSFPCFIMRPCQCLHTYQAPTEYKNCQHSHKSKMHQHTTVVQHWHLMPLLRAANQLPTGLVQELSQEMTPSWGSGTGWAQHCHKGRGIGILVDPSHTDHQQLCDSGNCQLTCLHYCKPRGLYAVPGQAVMGLGLQRLAQSGFSCLLHQCLLSFAPSASPVHPARLPLYCPSLPPTPSTLPFPAAMPGCMMALEAMIHLVSDPLAGGSVAALVAKA